MFSSGRDGRDIPHEGLRVSVSPIKEHQSCNHAENSGQATVPRPAGDTAGYCEVSYGNNISIEYKGLFVPNIISPL